MIKLEKFRLIPLINTQEKKRIYSDAIEFLYHLEPLIFIILPLFSAILCWGLWNSVNHTELVIWQISVVLITLVRYILYRLYFKFNPNRHPLPWAYYHIAHSIILGLIWAYASYIFLEQSSNYGHILWLVAIMGSLVSAMPFLAYWYPSFLAYSLPTALSMPIILFSYDTPEYQALSILAFMDCIFILLIAYRAHFFIIDSIKLRMQNTDLVKRLEKEKENAERSDRSKSQFLAAASHDLRQPLQALNLYLDALGSRLNNQEQYEILGKLQQSEQALSCLLNALLDVSKLDTANLSFQKKPLSCQELMFNLSTELIPQFEAKGIQFRLRVCHAFVYSDPTALTRIIRNLLKNALRYTQQGSVLFAARCRPQYVEFQIWDTGVGIPKDKQTEIFDDFVQLHNYERHQNQGLGLGLSIVKRLSVLLDHPITLRSKVNKGSVFSVQVPISKIPINTTIPNKTTQESATVVQSLSNTVQGKTLVLIEDQEEVLQATVVLLESWGYSVVSAHDLEGIMAKINQYSIYPDAIISDYRLAPPTTGIDVIEHLHEFYEDNIPAIIITGDTSPEMLTTFKIANIPILHKPIQVARLRTFLQRAINVYKA